MSPNQALQVTSHNLQKQKRKLRAAPELGRSPYKTSVTHDLRSRSPLQPADIIGLHEYSRRARSVPPAGGNSAG